MLSIVNAMQKAYTKCTLFAFIIDRFDGKIHIGIKNVIKKQGKTAKKGSYFVRYLTLTFHLL